MAEPLICKPKSNTQENVPKASLDLSSTKSLFHRRIEFHLERKPFSSCTNGGSSFQLETLNPTTDLKLSKHSAAQGVSSGKKQDWSDHVENGLDVELSIGITFRRIVSFFFFFFFLCFLQIASGLIYFLPWGF